MQEAGYRVGMIGTIESYDGRRRETVKNTTPESCEIHRLLSRMVENECDCCVMEVSSQGIALQRTADVFFDIGVFLNIEPDHIGKGEHATFSEYLHCKSRLMRQCGIGIVNQDDPNVDKILAGHTCEVENFSIRHPSDVMAEDEWYGMESGSLQSHFTVKREWRREEIVMQLPGQFNVYNALAAISVAGHFKVDREQIKAALAKQVVPGRCQNMSAGSRICVPDRLCPQRDESSESARNFTKIQTGKADRDFWMRRKPLCFEKVSDGRDGRQTGRFYHYHLG